MNTVPSYRQKRCSDCKRSRCHKGCNCDCHWEPWPILTNKTITQDTCPHDAKVKLAGYSGIYECTRCHKFIRIASWIV